MKNKFVTTTNNNLPLTVNITLTIFFLIVVRQLEKVLTKSIMIYNTKNKIKK